ncbi:hypothetical protein TWF696_009774 [Orbilia brochopaga]|uniref:Uncharacterized protein n=1 Tax=Orbilia brochopaga TaxID=3140254 RepID=A0AAV9UG04_9PEZI
MPDFHSEGIRMYLTSYDLPAGPEFNAPATGPLIRHPREAPPFALPETLRTDKHVPFQPDYIVDSDAVMNVGADDTNGNIGDNGSGDNNANGGDANDKDDDTILLPCYDENYLPIKYVRVTADPGAPLQVHFLIWSQQAIQDMDLPASEPHEFMDIRIEVSLDGHIVDVRYVNRKDITANGIPFALEFIGERCGDAKMSPLFFTQPTSTTSSSTHKNKKRRSTPARERPLAETHLNILVTLGRIGDYDVYDKSKPRARRVRTAPTHGKYESSTTVDNFNGYMWRKEHQNLIRDRAINPQSRLFEWRKQSWMDDRYRVQLQREAYEACAKQWEELERAEEEWEARCAGEVGEGSNGDDDASRRSSVPAKRGASADVDVGEDVLGAAEAETPLPKVKRVKVMAEVTCTATPTASGAPTPAADLESPYSFRHTRRADTPSTGSALQSSPSLPVQQSPLLSTAPTTAAGTPAPITKASTPQTGSSSRATFTETVQRGDAQKAARGNVTFGAMPFKTPRRYWREFVPYVDLCRVEYQIVNPE